MDGKRAIEEPRIVLIFLDSAREKFRYKKVHIENFLSLSLLAKLSICILNLKVLGVLKMNDLESRDSLNNKNQYKRRARKKRKSANGEL